MEDENLGSALRWLLLDRASVLMNPEARASCFATHQPLFGKTTFSNTEWSSLYCPIHIRSQEPLPCIVLQLVSETFQRDSPSLGKPIHLCLFYFYNFPSKEWKSVFLQLLSGVLANLLRTLQTYLLYVGHDFGYLCLRSWKPSLQVPQSHRILKEIESDKRNQRSNH